MVAHAIPPSSNYFEEYYAALCALTRKHLLHALLKEVAPEANRTGCCRCVKSSRKTAVFVYSKFVHFNGQRYESRIVVNQYTPCHKDGLHQVFVAEFVNGYLVYDFDEIDKLRLRQIGSACSSKIDKSSGIVGQRNSGQVGLRNTGQNSSVPALPKKAVLHLTNLYNCLVQYGQNASQATIEGNGFAMVNKPHGASMLAFADINRYAKSKDSAEGSNPCSPVRSTQVVQLTKRNQIGGRNGEKRGSANVAIPQPFEKSCH